MNFLYKAVLLLFVVISVTSCASVPLSSKDKKSLKTIALNDRVAMPKQMMYFAGGSQYGVGIGGIVGVAVAGSIDHIDENKIIKVISQNNIDLRKILIKQLSIELTKSGFILDNNSSAIMDIKILDYGFVAADGGFSFTNIKPILHVDAKITRNGKIIWEDTNVHSGYFELSSYSLDDIQHNPEILRQSLTQSASEITKKLVATLK